MRMIRVHARMTALERVPFHAIHYGVAPTTYCLISAISWRN